MESAEVGDCLLWNPNGVAVSMHKVSCGKAHRAEVTEMVDVSHQFTRWPGTAALQKAIDSGHPDLASKALLLLGMIRKDEGDTAGARNAYEQAIRSGSEMVSGSETVIESANSLLAELQEEPPISS